MFAPKVAKPQGKAAEALTGKSVDRRASPISRLSRAPVEQQLEAPSQLGSAAIGSQSTGPEAWSACGQPLAGRARALLEPRFGFDFSNVRIHADSSAHRAAAEADALAFTVGPHIVFGQGRYDPTSIPGLRLLAHELAHVVQQGEVTPRQLVAPGRALRSSSPAEEREAERASMLVLAGHDADLVPGREPAFARAAKPHSDENLGDVIQEFYEHNDHLPEDTLKKIRNSVIKATHNAKTYEVGYAFFDYYSGWFGNKIKLMSPEEAEKAKKQDRVAETSASSDTMLRPDVLDLNEDALGALLLHELSHTGHHANVAGSADVDEGHSYGIEYFYAERTGNKDRMEKILGIIEAGAIVLPAMRPALRQLFNVSYAVMTMLRKLSVTGTAPELAINDLGSEEAEMLLAEYVTKFADPSERLRKIIDYVTKHLSSFRTPTEAVPPATH